MKNASGTGMWMLGALLISILVAAGVYALLISPELDKASTARSELESAQEFNNLLDTQILAAQAAEKNVDDWYAEIAAIRLDLPPTPEQAELERLVNESLRNEGLPTVTLTYGVPTDVAPPSSDVGAVGGDGTDELTPAEDGTGAIATATASPTEDTDADPVAPDDAAGGGNSLPAAGLIQIPVTINTEGSPESVMRFLLDMQTQNSRFFTVTSFSISRSASVEAQAARPALEEGDWVINIAGLVFNLFDPELSLPNTEPGTTPPYTGGSVPNPFVPISGPA